MKKQITAILLSIIICLSSVYPAFATLPDTLTERKTEYKVIINPGNGSIKTNREEVVKSSVKMGRTYKYIDATPSDFYEIQSIELTVREDETIKNRINYNEKVDVDFYFTVIPAYQWDNEAFVTSTSVVNSVLNKGLNTNFRFSNAGIADDLHGIIYPQNVTKAYLFIPPDDSLVFSHFIDQDGNIFNLNDAVKKDLTLTPVYTNSNVAEADTFFGKAIHSVTILPGAGSLQIHNTHYDDEDYFKDIDSLKFVVRDGDTELIDITTPYSRLKFGDLERSDIFLQNGFREIMTYIESNEGKVMVEQFVNLVEESNTLWFTDGGIVNSVFSGEGLRENGYSLLFLLMMWSNFYGEETTSLSNLEKIMTDFENYDNLSEEQKSELLQITKTTIYDFKAEWDNFISSENRNCSSIFAFVTDVNQNGYISDKYVAGDYYNADERVRLKTPESENSYYVFSHFIDQDGNIFNLGDAVTKDLILTPIYYDRWDPFVATNGNVFITTEDNSDESFSVSVNRGSMGLFWANSGDNMVYDTFTNYVHSLFTEDEFKSVANDSKRFVDLFNTRSYFKINEGYVVHKTDIDGNELTEIEGLLLPLEFLNSKSSYTFDESLWTIDENGQITNYSGDIGLIGVPESINGITVTSISATAFADLSNKYIEDPSNSGNKELENASDYFENFCAIYLPRTLVNLKTGITDSLLKKLKNEYKNLDGTEEEKEIYSTFADCIYTSSDGTDDCTALAFLPASYVVVDSDNSEYSSCNGFLYDKNQTELLYIPFTARAELQIVSPAFDRIEEGLELPPTVNIISAFANWVAYNRSNYPMFGSISGLRSRNENITFNSYDSTFKVDASYLYDLLGTTRVEEMFGVSTKEELILMMDEEPLLFVNAFFWSSTSCQDFIFFTPKSETETNTTKSVRECIEKLYLKYYPDITQEELNSYVNEFLKGCVIQSDVMDGKINRNGLVSVDNPYSLTFLKNDEYIYSVSLNNIPERYKPVDIQTIIPSRESARRVTFNLELKKGNVRVISKSMKDTSLFLNATYQIIDSNGNVISEISSLSDGTKAAFNDLPYGEYTIVQTKIENGYALAASQSFSVTEDGQLIELEFLNDKASIYSVRVPKKIILNGSDGTADITISVKGNIMPTGKISVLPSAPLTLYEQASIDKKNNVTSSISITQSVWTSDNISLDKWSKSVWHISAPITAGIWQGEMQIIIKIESTE